MQKLIFTNRQIAKRMKFLLVMLLSTLLAWWRLLRFVVGCCRNSDFRSDASVSGCTVATARSLGRPRTLRTENNFESYRIMYPAKNRIKQNYVLWKDYEKCDLDNFYVNKSKNTQNVNIVKSAWCDLIEAGATFDNSFFDNSFVFLRQFKNRPFLGSVFVHVTGRSQN